MLLNAPPPLFNGITAYRGVLILTSALNGGEQAAQLTFIIVYYSLHATITSAVTLALAIWARHCDSDTEINTNGDVRVRVYKEIKQNIYLSTSLLLLN